MPRKAEPKPDNPAQSERFIEMARTVEVPGGPESFEETFGKIAKSKPEKPGAISKKPR